MTFDPNDPRLTAYLLGELDPADRAEIESMLQDSPEGRQAAEEIRLTAGWLTQQLHDEKAEYVKPSTSNLNSYPIAIGYAPTPPPGPRRRLQRSQRYAIALTAVAAGLIGCVILPLAHWTLKDQAPRNGLKQIGLADNTASVAPALRALSEAEAAPAPARGGANFGFADGSVRFFKSTREAARPEASRLAAPAGRAAANAAGRSLALARRSLAKNPREQAGEQQSLASLVPQRGVELALRDGSSVTAGLSPAPAQGEPSSRSRGEQLRRFALMAPGQGQQDAEAKPPATPPPPQASAGQVAQVQQQVDASRVDQAAIGERAAGIPAAQVPSLQTEARQLGQVPPASAPQAAGGEGVVAQQLAEAAPVAAEPDVAKDEVFAPIVDNPFVLVSQDRQSTFSIDVDTASYANVRRFLTQNMLPPKDAVRIEELLNYFPYNDPPPPPSSAEPFAVHVEVAGCPWNAGHRLARIGIAAQPIDQSRRPPSNLVFLVDVSGSMDAENKLPLVQWGLQRLVEQLGENDRVAIVVYASASGLFLPSTSCMKKAEILAAIEQLRAGGSTNGGAGIQIAYDVATQHFIKNGTNRVILATDGDFNVGITNDDELVRLIQAKAKSGVFLSVLGFGMGNLKDAKLEKLADKGNGHYAYIDSPREAYKVLVEEMGSTLVTVAKDVKIQLDFNPAKVGAFRLIGYENRVMAHQDFNDDTKDAGEIGAGHHVTALYELVPPGNESKSKLVELRSAVARKPSLAAGSGPELFTVKLRYKRPNEDTSRPLDQPAIDRGLDFARASDDLKLAAAVAGFGMMLRDSPYRGSLTYAGVLEIAQPTLARDPAGYRKEFVEMVRKAQALAAPAH